jgi:hypothetical protein
MEKDFSALNKDSTIYFGALLVHFRNLPGYVLIYKKMSVCI